MTREAGRKRILAALDDSESSLRSLPWVRLVFPGAEVTLAHVVEVADPLKTYADYVSELALRVSGSLDRLAHNFFPRARTVVRHGRAASEIASLAREIGADAIALTTHGGSRLHRRLIGGTAERLLHSADAPLLVVPAWQETPPPERLRKIAVPLDGSSASEMILPLAREIARAHGARMLLIHGLVELDRADRAFADMEGHAHRFPAIERIEAGLARAREEIQARFEGLAADLERDGVSAKAALVRGAIPEQVVKTAEDEGADLLVMAGHGHGAVKRAFLGSVASRLVREASFPVLVARYDALVPAEEPSRTQSSASPR